MYQLPPPAMYQLAPLQQQSSETIDRKIGIRYQKDSTWHAQSNEKRMRCKCNKVEGSYLFTCSVQ